MSAPRRSAALCFAFLWCQFVAYPQTLPNVDDVLKKVTETYHDVTQYELVAVMQTPGPVGSSEIHTIFKAPDKYRVEMKTDKVPQDASPDIATNDVLSIFDGKTLWDYRPALHRYTTPWDTFLNKPPRDWSPSEVDQNMGIGAFRNFAQFVNLSGQAKPRVLRVDTLTLNGQKFNCLVIEVSPPDGTINLWIDHQSWQVRRLDFTTKELATSLVFPVIKLNEPHPDELFQFKPPPDAHEP